MNFHNAQKLQKKNNMIPQTSKLTHIKLIAQILLNYLADFRADNNKQKFFSGTFKNFVNTFILKLSEIEAKYYDNALTKEEEATTVCYDVVDDFTKIVASVPVWEMRNIETIINAYNKDPKSIEGICRKILNN